MKLNFSPLNKMNGKSLVTITLFGYFVSLSLYFVFPLFVTILKLQGFDDNTIIFVQSFTLAMSAILLPFVGDLLTKNYFKSFLGLVGLLLVVGYSIFFIDINIPVVVVLFLGSCFMLGMSALNLGVTRVSEGLARLSEVRRLSSLTYFTTNLGMGLASVFALLFLSSHKSLLIVADLISTLIFLAVLYYVYTALKSTIRVTETRSGRITLDKELLLCGLCSTILFIPAYAQISYIPLLLMKLRPSDFVEVTASMVLINQFTVVVTSAILSKFESSRFNSRVRTFFIFLGFVFSFSIMSSVTSWHGIILLTVLWSVGEALLYPEITHLFLSTHRNTTAALVYKEISIKISLVLIPIISLAAFEFNAINTISSLVFACFSIVGIGLLVFLQGRNSTLSNSG